MSAEASRLSQLVFAGTLAGVGRFRCRADHPRFTDTGPTGGHLMVFPREPVTITHAGGKPIVADATRVMFYNQGQEYRRRAISPAGDRCEWLALPATAVAEATRRHRPEVELGRPFADLTHGPADARSFLLARALLHHVRCARPIDSLLVDEIALTLLDELVGRAWTARGAAAARAGATAARGHVEVAAATEELLAMRFAEPLSLPAIAGVVGVSPFHLARVFRRHAGTSLHGRRTQLRLHAALLRILDGGDLTAVALEVGLSSHSHLSTTFRAAFGVSPSRLRALSSSDLARMTRPKTRVP
jgi:AraC-like DNA-binding protein